MQQSQTASIGGGADELTDQNWNFSHGLRFGPRGSVFRVGASCDGRLLVRKREHISQSQRATTDLIDCVFVYYAAEMELLSSGTDSDGLFVYADTR